MLDVGIILPVKEPIDWVSSLFIIKNLMENYTPSDLNKEIKREYFKLLTAEEIFTEMHNPKYFPKHNASDGYWQIAVDEKCPHLLAFNTSFGRYQFIR